MQAAASGTECEGRISVRRQQFGRAASKFMYRQHKNSPSERLPYLYLMGKSKAGKWNRPGIFLK
jgi:hypothetical protein